MHLTRMALNPARRGCRHLLSSSQRMHAAVLAAFPPAPEQASRVLWRVDLMSSTVQLYVASSGRPDLTHVVEQAGWPTNGAWETTPYGPFLDRLESGQRWAFRLTANPVRSVPRAGERGRVSAHVTVKQQEQWLLDRCHRLGFSIPTGVHGVPDLTVKNRRTDHFERHATSGSGRVVVAKATYDGVLEVSDAGALRTALTQGVGRAKAYGCGLLTLARP